MSFIETLKPRQKTLIVMSFDLLIIITAYITSYMLRFNSLTPKIIFQDYFYPPFIAAVIVQFATFYFSGIYRAIWRFSSTPDLIRIIKAVTLAIPVTVVTIFLWNRLEKIPRSTFIIDWCLLIIGLGGGRFAYRVFRDYQNMASLNKDESSSNVIIIGAGSGAEKIVREIKDNPEMKLRIVGLLDDDPGKKRKVLHGIPVLGPISELANISGQMNANKVFIAIPSASSKTMRKIVKYAEGADLDIKTLPKMKDIMNGRVDISLLRNVNPEDLLGRDSVNLDFRSIRELIEQKTIIVTGAGGSIGSELTKQICSLRPKTLVLYEVSEYNLYALENELNQKYPEVKIISIIGDVRNYPKILTVLKSFPIDIIFHAAAYKHVPIMETNPLEAVNTNIFGTENVARAAVESNIKRFVLISTDKAINPTNIMGTTKRVAEQVCQMLSSESDVKFMVVRFGNVLGSSGSVVPLFKQQIETGGPVTVTHPEITRYFMSIPEAAQLVIQSASIGVGGEVFVLEMGDAVKIVDLATEMITLAGLRVGEDIDIKFTGLRPGEKLYEELFFDDEHSIPTGHAKVRIAKVRKSHPSLEQILQYLRELPEDTPLSTIQELLKTIVPEYKMQSGEETFKHH